MFILFSLFLFILSPIQEVVKFSILSIYFIFNLFKYEIFRNVETNVLSEHHLRILPR